MQDPGAMRPYISLFIGIALIALGIMSTLGGEALGGRGRMFYRTQEPNKFWSAVAIDFLGGAFGIGYFLYKVYMHSN
jgi:hypothetical protein